MRHAQSNETRATSDFEERQNFYNTHFSMMNFISQIWPYQIHDLRLLEIQILDENFSCHEIRLNIPSPPSAVVV